MQMTMDRLYFIDWRKRMGMTQQQLADRWGVNVFTIKKWESGARKLPPYIGLLMAAIEANLEPIGKEHMIPVDDEKAAV